jgi:hypothetical protein
MKIPLDKAFHFLAGWAIAATFQSVPLFAAALVAAAGIGKEIWDKRSGKGTPDPMDAIATLLGGVGGLVVSFAVSALA